MLLQLQHVKMQLFNSIQVTKAGASIKKVRTPLPVPNMFSHMQCPHVQICSHICSAPMFQYVLTHAVPSLPVELHGWACADANCHWLLADGLLQRILVILGHILIAINGDHVPAVSIKEESTVAVGNRCYYPKVPG
jgi:hypothetical protein